MSGLSRADNGISGLGSTDNALVRTDGTGGDQVQGSSVTVDDAGNLVVPASAGVVIGGATRRGVRLEVNSGGLDVKEGDDSALGPRLGAAYVDAKNGAGTLFRAILAGEGSPRGLILASTSVVNWSSTSSAVNAPDTGLKRAAAGVVQVTDGSTRGGALKVGTYTVATLPSASTVGAGTIAYVSDGAAGSPVLAFSDGKNWLRCDTLAVVSSS